MKKLFIAFTRFRASLTRNQIFFMIAFGIIASIGVFYGLFPQKINENAQQKNYQTISNQLPDIKNKHSKPPLMAADQPQQRKGGSINVQGNIEAGNGDMANGGNANIKAGDGEHGASGGDINIGPGTYKAGNGGPGGKGGDLNIKAGDAK